MKEMLTAVKQEQVLVASFLEQVAAVLLDHHKAVELEVLEVSAFTFMDQRLRLQL
jgi:hypothetical protein